MEPRKNIRWSTTGRRFKTGRQARIDRAKEEEGEEKVHTSVPPSVPSPVPASPSSSSTLSLFDKIKIPLQNDEKEEEGGPPKCPIKDCNRECEPSYGSKFRPICNLHRRAGFNAKQVKEAIERLKASATLKEPLVEEEEAPVLPVPPKEEKEEESTTALYTRHAVEAFMEKNFVESKQTLCKSFEKKIAELHARLERLKDEEADYFASHEVAMAQLQQEKVQIENEKQGVDQEQVVLLAKWTEERLELEKKHRSLQSQLKEMPSKFELSIDEDITRRRLKQEDKQVQALHTKGSEDFTRRRNELDAVRQECQKRLEAVEAGIGPPVYTNPLLLAMNDEVTRLACLQRCLLQAIQVAEETFRVSLGQQIQAEAAVFFPQDANAMDIDTTNNATAASPDMSGLIQDQIEVDLED
jgi:hypothetical protein